MMVTQFTHAFERASVLFADFYRERARFGMRCWHNAIESVNLNRTHTHKTHRQ
jgi:hypothetical protein